MRAVVRADPKFSEITGQAVRVRCGITISALLAVLMARLTGKYEKSSKRAISFELLVIIPINFPGCA